MLTLSGLWADLSSSKYINQFLFHLTENLITWSGYIQLIFLQSCWSYNLHKQTPLSNWDLFSWRGLNFLPDLFHCCHFPFGLNCSICWFRDKMEFHGILQSYSIPYVHILTSIISLRTIVRCKKMLLCTNLRMKC